MAHVIKMPDGKTDTIFGLDDAFDLIEQYAGNELRQVLEELLSETYCPEVAYEEIEREHQKELDEIREHYHHVCEDLRDASEELANLIRAERLDRKKISNVAGRIGKVTWRELC